MPDHPNAADDLLTADDVAERLRCSRRHVLKLAREGELSRVKIGRKLVLFEPAAVDDFIARHSEGPALATTAVGADEIPPRF